jgi:flagellar hook-length control protein FliK
MLNVQGDSPEEFEHNLDWVTDNIQSIIAVGDLLNGASVVTATFTQADSNIAATVTTPAASNGSGEGLSVEEDKWGKKFAYGHPDAPDLPDGRGKYILKFVKLKSGEEVVTALAVVRQGGEATLRISPDGLGPVEIRLKLDGDRVELGFTATQQDTRQALQDALPKLREMLAQQGLQLGQADVGQKHAQSSNDDSSKSAKGFAGDDEGDAIVLAGTQRESNVIVGRVGRGVLDLYA